MYRLNTSVLKKLLYTVSFSLFFFFLFFLHPTNVEAAAQFVQGNTASITTGKTVTVNFNQSNSAGNLIAIYVLWDNTGTFSISDTNHNVYSNAVGPTAWGAGKRNSQVLYAKNIAGGSNTISIQFATAIKAFAGVYIQEYSGLDTVNPVDGVKAATGTASAMNSGNLTTTYANDLLYAPGASLNTVTQAGSGYTVRSWAYGNIIQDKSVSAAGTYNATATQNGTGWVMHLVAFKASTALPTATPTPTTIPTSTPTATPTATPTPTSLPTATPTPTAIPSPTPSTIPSGVVVAINAGGGAYLAADGTSYAADSYFSGGNTYATSASIANTTDDTVYQSERWGGFSYAIPVPQAGIYTVKLQFAEIYFTQPGSRVFSVTAEGQPFVTNVDIVAAAGANTAYDVNRAITVTDGMLNIAVSSSVDNPKLNGIVIYSNSVTGTPTPTATLTPTATPTPTISITPTVTPTPLIIYPLKQSANKRYLVDQNNTPVLLMGDSAQALVGAISPTDAETFFANRAAKGVNVVWIHMICGATYSGCHADGTTYDGIAPFTSYLPGTTTYDLDSPNAVYFARVDQMVALAAQYNITLIMSPMETINWLGTLKSNGVTKAYNYGAYVGNRYKNNTNVLWFHGNDFQTWSNAGDDAVVLAVANGIQSVDPNHIQTVELDYPTSASLNDSQWSPVVGLDLAYSYYSTYDQVLREYNRTNFIPTFFHEGVYEYQDYMGGYTGPHQLRAQEYWTQLSGAAGNVYGNRYIFRFEPNLWKSHMNDIGFIQFGYWHDFFAAIPWYNLVPDQNHTVVTAGYGTYQSIAAAVIGNTSDYVTTARTPDGTRVVSYLPTLRTITVDMSRLSGPATARWFDPTNGTYTTIAGSPFANTGSRQFTPPGNNSAGEGDWVLDISAQ